MWFVGDVHGKIEEFRNLLERRIFPNSEPGELVIQVGDMAIGHPKVHLPVLNSTVRFIRGNHDNPGLSRQHPNYMGNTRGWGHDYGYDEKHKLFWLAGAWSIDSALRIAHERLGSAKTWWADEQLSPKELEKAFQLYIEKKPEVVVSHEAPASIVPEVLWISTAPSIFPGDPMYNKDMANLRIETGYYQRKEKLGCVETDTSRTLQRMLNHHAPKDWVFGHYHISKSLLLGGTRFKCCAELEPYRIEEQDARLE